jgi:hypothetical protein
MTGFFTLLYFPSQGMFPASGANHQNVHLLYF